MKEISSVQYTSCLLQWSNCRILCLNQSWCNCSYHIQTLSFWKGIKIDYARSQWWNIVLLMPLIVLNCIRLSKGIGWNSFLPDIGLRPELEGNHTAGIGSSLESLQLPKIDQLCAFKELHAGNQTPE